MKNVFAKVTAVSAAMLLAAAFGTAQAATKEDVAKARSQCATKKANVRNLERSKSGDLTQAKADWESACQQAEVLINELNGTKPPQVVAPTSP